jgi:hypothetical protein
MRPRQMIAFGWVLRFTVPTHGFLVNLVGSDSAQPSMISKGDACDRTLGLPSVCWSFLWKPPFSHGSRAICISYSTSPKSSDFHVLADSNEINHYSRNGWVVRVTWWDAGPEECYPRESSTSVIRNCSTCAWIN